MAKGVKTGGRKAGTPNKITAAFKDAVLTVYGDIGGDGAFAEWAKANRGEYYRIAARLIPSELKVSTDTPIQVFVNRDGAMSEAKKGAAE